MSANLNQPLKWHGGKNYIAKKIVALMPRHLNYVEPYFGGGAVLFARDPNDESLWLHPHKGVSEVINDLSGELTNFWRTLAHEEYFEDFRRRIEAMPFSGWEFFRAKEHRCWTGHDWQNKQRTMPCVDCAEAFFVLNRQSLAGRMNGFTGITKTRLRSGMNNEVSAWLNTIEGLPTVHDRLKRVLILPPQPALKVIEKFDSPETFFYLDPPYVHSTRATTTEYGEREMSEDDHQKLLAACFDMQGNFLLSGYHCPQYDSFAADAGWDHHEFKVPNQASGAKKKETKTEVVWANYTLDISTIADC